MFEARVQSVASSFVSTGILLPPGAKFAPSWQVSLIEPPAARSQATTNVLRGFSLQLGSCVTQILKFGLLFIAFCLIAYFGWHRNIGWFGVG